MNFFTFDIRKVLLVMALIIGPLLAINMQRKAEEDLWFTKPFRFLAGVIQQGYSSFSSGVRGTTSLYIDLIGVKRLNRELTQQNAELRAQLGALTELKLENERLSELLGFKQTSQMDLIAARVIGKDLLPDHQTVSINRGTYHGVQKNMAALTVGGVVGYVFRAETFTSHILLLTDGYAAIDAVVQRSRSRGIVEGRNRESSYLKYLRRSDDVVVGDLVVTSGLQDIFPKGFPIGIVSSVNKSRYGMTQEVLIDPVVVVSNLEELFVVRNARQESYFEEAPKDRSEN